MRIFVGLLTTELGILEANTLKDKRQVLHSLLTRLPQKFKVAVAEVAHHDVHRRACIATVTVSNSEAQAHRVLMTVSEFIRSEPRVIVQAETVEIM
jgi:uncharacterized protein YlxP (DUF503 family)